MTQRFLEATFAIKKLIDPAERQIKDAALGATTLLQTMLHQHAASGADDQIGLAAIGHAARAAMHAIEAREASIRAHGALNTDLKKVGLSEMMGKDGPAPPNGPGEFQTFFTTGSLDDERKVAAE